MLWGGRWEGGSCLGTHVKIKDFKIEKLKKIKKLRKNKIKNNNNNNNNNKTVCEDLNISIKHLSLFHESPTKKFCIPLSSRCSFVLTLQIIHIYYGTLKITNYIRVCRENNHQK